MKPTATISIVYCKPCGYLRHAEAAALRLENELGVAAELVPGKGGIFEVRVDGDVVAKRMKGHFPDADQIVAAVGAALPKSAARPRSPQGFR